MLPIVPVCRDEGPWNENCLIQFMEDDQGHLELDFDTDPYVSTILNSLCSAENNSKHSIQHVFTICSV
jgi:hypothetical protein